MLGTKPIIVAVGGYFDPLHSGHLEYFKLAKALGDILIVIVNNDEQSIIKKGFVFMPIDERIKIISSLRMVDHVVVALDKDKTISKTLEMLKPDIYAKGGDWTVSRLPEVEKIICKKYNIKIVDGLGEKINNSSEIIKKATENRKNINKG